MTIIANNQTGPLELLVAEHPIGQKLTGSELYRHTLEMLGIELAGVYIGGRCIDLIDKLGQSEKIKIVTGPCESDLGHAVQAYFKVTRKPGVLVVTSGPGGTNAATPVKDAHSDSDALILTIGQVPDEDIVMQNEPFQGAAMIEPFGYWSKWTYRITKAEEIQPVLKTAYQLSISGRPGPVVIELPSPVAQFQKAKLNPLDEVPLIDVNLSKPIVYSVVDVKPANLDDVTDALIHSKRPAMIAGNGVYNARATEYLLQVAEKGQIPFMTTLLLLGAVKQHRLNHGLPGMHGPTENNLAVHNSDVVVYIGGRLDDRVVGDPDKFAPDAKIFWIEPNYPGISPTIASRVYKVMADSKDALQYMLANLPQLEHERWISQIDVWGKKYPLPTHVPREVIEQIRKFVTMYEPKEPYITTGVGAHQMFLAEFWHFNPEQCMKMLLSSGGLGTMGTGMPFGIGAAIADPHRPVYVFNGDGSSIMDQRSKLMAWQLAQEGSLYGIKEVLFRDGTLGMVDFWQTEFWESRKTATEIRAPLRYFEKAAEQNEFAYFMADYRTNVATENRKILEYFVQHRGNAVLEVRMLPESVRPLIPAGKGVQSVRLNHSKELDPADLMVGKNW